MAPVRYSIPELRTVRDYIAGKRRARAPADEPLVEKLKAENSALLPLAHFATEEPSLFDKLASDPRAAKFSYFMFFPILEPHLDSDFEKVDLRLSRTRSRGLAAQIIVGGTDVVIKPVQSPDDPKLAAFAGEHGIGPVQYPSLDRFLTEEFLSGEPFAEVSTGLTPDTARLIGKRVAEMLSILHPAGILFNDVIFDDDFGGSHLLLNGKGDVRLIDFGVSIDLSAFPDLTDDQVFRYLYTLPGIGGLLQNGMLSEDDIAAKITIARGIFAGQTREQLLARDLDFVHEGLGITSMTKNSMAAGIIHKTFTENYKR